MTSLIKRTKNEIFAFPIGMIWVFGILFLVHCQSSIPSPNSKKPSDIKNTQEKTVDSLPSEKIQLLNSADTIEYYELPGTTDLSNPEDLLTFSLPVKNRNHIHQIQRLILASGQTYHRTPPRDCKPSFNSALVFQSPSKKETVLFSINCGLIYLYQEKLFIDVFLQRMDIEMSFRQIRSGR